MDKPFPSMFSSPSESPGFLLWQVTNTWQRKLRIALKAVDLTHVQFVLLAVLSWLSHRQNDVTQAQLAQHSYVDVMMASQVVRTLEEKGLINRLTHPSDTRAKSLRVTDKGSAIVAQAIGLVESADQSFFGGLQDQAAFIDALRCLLQSDKEGE